MKISVNWLKDYLDFNLPVEKLVDKINLHMTEVESVDVGGLIVGKVLKKEKHPNADRLSLCQVDVGKETLSIVCGGPNVDKDQLVVVATVGTTLPGGLQIKEAEIRGEKSCGMICSEAELELSRESEGILVLPEDKYEIGQSFSLKDGDAVIELKVLANRPDYLSYLGVARDLGVVLGKEAKLDIDVNYPIGKVKDIKVEIDASAKKEIPRYQALPIGGVKVGPSPKWLQSRLVTAGLRPINNIVDVTNYVMLETGQPLHAFDRAKISGDKIIIRKARVGESLAGLDGGTHKLTTDDLVIADDKKAMAVAGIVGGEESSVQEGTKEIVLESANFDFATVRRTTQRIGLRTDSSIRFEKSLSPLSTEMAIKRATHLIAKLAGGEAGNISEAGNKWPKPKSINVEIGNLEKLLGLKLDSKKVKDILKALDFTVSGEKKLSVIPPHFRGDITGEADIAEEVLRIIGVDKVKPTKLKKIKPAKRTAEQQHVYDLKDAYANDGFEEIYTRSFSSKGEIELANPLSRDRAFLRTNLKSGVVENIINNSGHTKPPFLLFEIGEVYLDKSKVTNHCLLAAVGFEKENLNKVFGPRVVELLSEADSAQSEEKSLRGQGRNIKNHRYWIVEFKVDDAKTLHKGEFHPKAKKIEYKPLPKYPVAKFDLAIIVDDKIKADEVIREIEKIEGVYGIELFDEYAGSSIGKGKKSLAFHLEYFHPNRTLTTDEAQEIHAAVIAVLEDKFSVRVRD